MKKKYNFLLIKLFYIIKIANGGNLESNSKQIMTITYLMNWNSMKISVKTTI